MSSDILPSGRGPAGIILIQRLLFGSGGDHCNHELAVEVRREAEGRGKGSHGRATACDWPRLLEEEPVCNQRCLYGATMVLLLEHLMHAANGNSTCHFALLLLCLLLCLLSLFE